MSALDPRVTPARGDIAARTLRGLVEAERFVDGRAMRVRSASAALRRAPSGDAALDSELLHGEDFTVYDAKAGWAWGQAALDGYVGYVPETALGEPGPAPTHRVTALRTFVFPSADIKRPPALALSYGARLAVTREEGNWAATAEGGFVFAAHLAPLAHTAPDFVATAGRFLGTPYLWGGRSSLGLDCSALVQLALMGAGIASPRDSDQQEAALGSALPPPFDGLARGDLVFWKGHVGLMADAAQLLHANAAHMAVTLDPLAEVLPRAGAIRSVRRLA
ncbi:MAG: C40 family peptidase [Alphaproteobacteria bacterium]|nr:C40 family peptidase [Alphaproteobacteria bacterium]